MNLSARIKSGRTKPNYVLNVNINIPIRPTQLESYRPLSGEFTFSPNHNKKLKLEIPSARTTNECESRKISYLGETQNTISYRHNNRKKSTKSAFPTEQISQLINASKKTKSQFRSQAVSPNGRKSGAKKSKVQSSHQITKSKDIINGLLTQSQDNIMGDANESSEIEIHEQLNLKKANSKRLDSPILEEERGLIHEIREFEKSAQFKKEHLNYEYLKSKVLVLASVKKIQRAWRSYKTKKLIKSYSNNISLKFTGKMKNQLVTGQQAEETKILTVRSCGYNGQINQFKRQGKKNISQLYPREDPIEEEVQNGNAKFNQTIVVSNMETEIMRTDKIKERNVKSAIVKFQMEEIKKWEELIKNIKQGKKVDEVLEKSFRRKQELEKQLSNNLKEMISSKNSQSSHRSNRDEQPINKAEDQIQIREQKSSDVIISEVSVSSSSEIHEKLTEKQEEHILSMEEKLKPFETDRSQLEEEEGATTQRRREKLEYFENELRKIDNEYSESNLSHSQYSESSALNTPEQICMKNPYFTKEAEQQQNLKLKRKIQAINRIQMFNYQQEEEDQMKANKYKDKDRYLYTSLEHASEQPPKPQVSRNRLTRQSQLEQVYEQKNGQFFPLTISKDPIKPYGELEFAENDRLQTFRSKNSSMSDPKALYEDLQKLRLKQLRKKKLSQGQKSSLVAKIEQEILFDLLLQFSERDGLITKMETLYLINSQKQAEPESEKPQGICTNLESIKDYLENFVAFAFDQESMLLMQGFNQPRGPSPQALLKSFNKNLEERKVDFYSPVLSEKLFNQHWTYASEQIYFDAKYPTDPTKEQDRVKHLKQITRMYFRAIFDCFNECLSPLRVYGLEGKPFPWEFNLKNKASVYNLVQIKPLIRAGYRKLSQLAVIYCGLLFEDKKHSMSFKMVQQIQKQRLETLIEIELEEEEYKWKSTRLQKAEVLYKLSEATWQLLMLEFCQQLLGIGVS